MSDRKDTTDLASRLEDAADPGDPSRRSFIQAGAGVVVGAAALVGVGRQLRVLKADADRPVTGSGEHHETTYADVELRINGETRRLRLPHQRTLLLTLREDLGLTGTKKSCNLGQCGACTVLMDGLPCMPACCSRSMRPVTTSPPSRESARTASCIHFRTASCVTWAANADTARPAWCMSGVALLEKTTHVRRQDEVKRALSGNLCRCGNYRNEIASVLSVGACVC